MSRLDQLLALHAQDPNDATLHYMIASEHVREGRPAEALPWLATYVKLGTDVGAGWSLMADCHEALDDAEHAREALRQGIDAARRGGHPTLAGELSDRLAELG